MGHWDPYSSGKRTEPDIRQEMEHFLDGFGPEIAKPQTALLRKMRRDSNGELTQCACVDPITREPDIDTYCSLCMGEAYYWDEDFVELYKVVVKSDVGNAQREVLLQPSLMNIPIVVFYTRSSVSITEDDKIIELVRDNEGIPSLPLKRHKVYSIGSLIDIRSDHGRIEYWKVACYEEKVKFLNGPST